MDILTLSILALAFASGIMFGVVAVVILLITLHPNSPDLPLTTYPRKFADLPVARVDPLLRV